jgi:hypothetical protein
MSFGEILIALALSIGSVASVDGGIASGSDDQSCPVRFADLQQSYQSPSALPDALLVAHGTATIDLLAPRSEGFQVLVVESGDFNAFYGSYRTEGKIYLQKFDLDEGSRAIAWMAATTVGRLPEVKAGKYRLMLRYMSAGEQKKSKWKKVCFALSATFELLGDFVVVEFQTPSDSTYEEREDQAHTELL